MKRIERNATAQQRLTDLAKLRAWWWHRQGLDGSLAGKSPAEVLHRSGWSRSVGGVGPYLTFFSRAALGREAVDRALAEMQIHELPSARGCAYVLPAADFALGLAVSGGASSSDSDYRTALKLGVTEKEIAKLKDAVLAALAHGPLEPDEIRAATGNASRSLGEAGKKKGITTTLPLALGQLQTSGHIRRVPTNGRLDQQRYRYALWRPNPLAQFKLSREEAAVEIARRYFGWAGPATLAEFQWFSGWSAKACAAAVEPLGLVPVGSVAQLGGPATGEAPGPTRLLLPDELDRFSRFTPAKGPQYALVSSIDAMFLLRRDLASLLEAQDLNSRLFKHPAMADARGLKDLPSHAILDRGRLVGLWEFEPERGELVWTAWAPSASTAKQDAALLEAVSRTEAFIREDLGDARSFSLDSPKGSAPRIAAIRKA